MMNEDAIAGVLAAPILCFFNSFSCFFMTFWVVGMLIVVIGFILWIFMLIDVIRREDKGFPGESKDQKMLWLLIILLGSWMGAVIYYFMVYKKKGAAK